MFLLFVFLDPFSTHSLFSGYFRWCVRFSVATSDYDHQRLQIEGTKGLEQPKISYEEATGQIQLWRKKENLGGLFGNEKDESFKSSLATIYQTFGDAELYPSIEEKAANLLYFIVKNHSFSDGDKRIADNALVAFTLLIAESKPNEKETIVKVIINLINDKND